MFCYNIPTIDPDLRHEETILQAINVFEFLNQTKPSSKSTGPQNFIDDLHNKLQMRRKGISGARENQEPGNVIDRLSALIPPPPPKMDASTASATDSNDDDWD